MEATIIIDNLQIYTHIGCYAEERRVGTWLTFSARLVTDISKPSATDDVADALNYVEVCEVVKEEAQHEAHLIENVAARIAQRLRNEFTTKGLQRGTITISKPHPPIGMQIESVAIEVEI